MPKAARRLGFAVGQMGRFLAATKYPFLSQNKCKIIFDILLDMDYKDG
jgi:hypothetical protein